MRVAELLLTLSLVGEALPATAAEADEAIDVDVSSLELLKRHQVDFWTPWESNTNATSAAALLLRSETSGCVDKNWQCYGWARLGYCSSNAGYMRRNCRHSCNLCGRESCRGLNQPCWINAQCCSARCAQNTYHCRPVGR
ncbi:hypothetical protein AK812_SmicGene31159 [Symbiodinium microadriaticum]|uniref:ShKT domain-containing protein n=1 Tax=Symbiodinium microadriaticum TaxID=2951 RepID=A0A1Q9CXH9_SYMMI|nr:hypothetical protein AK812_SmicGene31159 [Symbiodinium microadriaticum]|mmetsp:Transcript_53234/g.127316  ORF Transcript_53234/g.127316 Transcript_53234/m.127316 type:complete len:140 (+) Transcript_53234:73-492(+)